MNIELHLRLVGVLLFVLLTLNFVLPRRFHWREELARLSLFNRQIFIVHAMFICLTLAMFGALSLFYAPALLQPHPLAKAVLAGLTLFWFVRLLVQWFVYSPDLWRGKRFETFVHILFSGLWLYFTATYGLALWTHVAGGGLR